MSEKASNEDSVATEMNVLEGCRVFLERTFNVSKKCDSKYLQNVGL